MITEMPLKLSRCVTGSEASAGQRAPKVECTSQLNLTAQSMLWLDKSSHFYAAEFCQSLRDYEWCSDQMKAIRQDLTLQNIKDAFAAEVYESHARLALENRDYSNYKQCQVRSSMT